MTPDVCIRCLASERCFRAGVCVPLPQKSGRRWVAFFPQLVITNSIRVQHNMNPPAATAIQCRPAMKLWKLIVASLPLISLTPRLLKAVYEYGVNLATSCRDPRATVRPSVLTGACVSTHGRKFLLNLGTTELLNRLNREFILNVSCAPCAQIADSRQSDPLGRELSS